MKTPAMGLALIVSGVLASTAHAAIDGSKPVICAVAEVTECLPEDSCQRVKAIDANLPRFLRLAPSKARERGAPASRALAREARK